MGDSGDVQCERSTILTPTSGLLGREPEFETCPRRGARNHFWLTSGKPSEHFGAVPLQEFAFWLGFFPTRHWKRNTVKRKKKIVQLAGAVQS